MDRKREIYIIVLYINCLLSFPTRCLGYESYFLFDLVSEYRTTVYQITIIPIKSKCNNLNSSLDEHPRLSDNQVKST